MFHSTTLALAVLLAAPTDAFVPSLPSPLQHTCNVGTFSPKTLHEVSSMPSTIAPRAAGVSMNMGSPKNLVDLHNMFVYVARPDLALTDQLIRVARANMKNVVKNIDSKSPENVVNRALQDMQNDLIKIKQAYTESVDLQRSTIMQKRQADAVADDWYHRATYALKRGYEVNAKDALRQRQKYLEAAKNLQIQIDAQSAAMERLYEGMQVIEEKFREALGKRTELISRAKTAQSVKKVNELLSGMKGNTSLNAFDRLEAKVTTMEAEADESMEQILRRRTIRTPRDDELEMEFQSLENSASIEHEYEKLKKDLKKSLAGRPINTDAEIKRELQQLGRRAVESGYF